MTGLPLDRPLNEYIDHTLLRPDVTHAEFESFLDEAIKYKFASVCVPPHIASSVKIALTEPGIRVGTVVGFPHGNLPIELKLREIIYHSERHIDEIDFVVNYSELKSGHYNKVGQEIEAIGRICKERHMVSKCIIETCYLTEDEKTFMYRAIEEYTLIDFIKTSTGFGKAGAQLQDVKNWKARQRGVTDLPGGTLITFDGARIRPVGIKAAGGIKDLDTALCFIEAGADRLGTSASARIMEEYNERMSSAFTERKGAV